MAKNVISFIKKSYKQPQSEKIVGGSVKAFYEAKNGTMHYIGARTSTDGENVYGDEIKEYEVGSLVDHEYFLVSKIVKSQRQAFVELEKILDENKD